MNRNTKLVAITALSLAAWIVTAQSPTFPNASQLSPSISTIVQPGANGNVLRYAYTISNAATSQQSLEQWAFQYQSPVTITITATPAGWLHNESIGNQTIAGWTALATVLAPGTTAGGFQLEAEGLPGIVPAFAAGEIPVDKLPRFEDGQAPESVLGSGLLENSVKLKVVGPTPVPPNFTPLAFLAVIIAAKEQAFARGWIDNSGVQNSLDAKLNAAQAALQRGNNRAAKNELDALIHEVDAQAGKHLTPEAVALLKFNTQYLISKIP